MTEPTYMAPVVKVIKLHTCPVCRGMYQKWSSTQRTCNDWSCAIGLARLDREKKAKREAKAQRIMNKNRLEELKPRRVLMKEAQQAFNAFIRERDRELPCCCCGAWGDGQTVGGAWDAGHYLSVGAYPELRFTEDNCHRQKKSCNAGSGKYTGKQKTVSQEYRERLIAKIGLERVEELEGPHPPAKWSCDDLREIKRVYKGKLREL
jgi:hypothetical protein